MAEHTPIPWRRNGHFVETATKPPFAVCDVYGDGQILQEVGDLIVRAVNCHEELVAALESLIDWGTSTVGSCMACNALEEEERDPTRCQFCIARAALAKVKPLIEFQRVAKRLVKMPEDEEAE